MQANKSLEYESLEKESVDTEQNSRVEMINQRFSKDDVGEIVREALELENSNKAQSLSYADLEDIASQCGVSREALTQAIESRKLASTKDNIRQAWRNKALTRLMWPTVVCTMLIIMNVSGGGFPWAIFPVIFWWAPELGRAKSKLFPSDLLLTEAARRMAAKESHAV